MSDIDSDLVFKGHTPGSISCEDFVRAVRKHAVIEKKSRDDEYIADYAMSCLADDALHWAEDLSGDVQGDWSLLRRALLVEYGSSTQKPASMTPSLPSAMIPVPAAAPPPTSLPSRPPVMAASPLTQQSSATSFLSRSSTIRGRIQVIAPGFRGYLSKQFDEGGSMLPDYFRGHCLTTTFMSNAGVFSGTVDKGVVQFQFENLDRPPSSFHATQLGAVWLQNGGTSGSGSGFAALTNIHTYGSTATSGKGAPWHGPVVWVKWVRSADNTLTPSREDMPGPCIGISDTYSMAQGHHIEMFPDPGVFVTATWIQPRLVFEPL